MLKDSTVNILLQFTPVMFQEIRNRVVSCVLATDMAQHFEYITKFKSKIKGTGSVYNNIISFRF
jgi:hypothetical protein